MTPQAFEQRLRQVCAESVPLPGLGQTPERHRRLLQVGREDLSLAKLVEAHWDAIAILAEAGRTHELGRIYGVWASEIPGQALRTEPRGGASRLFGTKMFSSGAGLIDRALLSIGLPEQRMIDLDLRANAARIQIDGSGWQTDAFRLTSTGTVHFDNVEVPASAFIGDPQWYLERSGFWHGALGPAACWAGGAAGLLDAAMHNKRDDPHTLAHLAAMDANIWAMEAMLDAAGREIDADPGNRDAAMIRALRVRHLIEQLCTDTLRRFARAYGPFPLAMDANISRRYHELDLYLRQSHAERDLEALARAIKAPARA